MVTTRLICNAAETIQQKGGVAYRGLATEQAVRSKLRMHGLMPYRHVPLQLEIDRANGALQICCSAIDQYQVKLYQYC